VQPHVPRGLHIVLERDNEMGFDKHQAQLFFVRRFRFFSRIVVVLFLTNLQHSGMILQYVGFSDWRLFQTLSSPECCET